jgi:polyketide biosynthesis enoyl-CoA hydratase PksH
MGAVIAAALPYETLRVRVAQDVCFIQIHRPDANNSINDRLIEELTAALDRCGLEIKVVVLEGSPEVFCFGAEAAAYRVEAFPDYHADRPPVPDKLAPQWEKAEGFYRALGWDAVP